MRVYQVPKKIRGVISSFADIALGEADKGGQDKGGLSAVIEKAKAEKRMDRFALLVRTPLAMWFYQYTENFHCRPETVDDMMRGIKYLMFTRKSDG